MKCFSAGYNYSTVTPTQYIQSHVFFSLQLAIHLSAYSIQQDSIAWKHWLYDCTARATEDCTPQKHSNLGSTQYLSSFRVPRLQPYQFPRALNQLQTCRDILALDVGRSLKTRGGGVCLMSQWEFEFQDPNKMDPETLGLQNCSRSNRCRIHWLKLQCGLDSMKLALCQAAWYTHVSFFMLISFFRGGLQGQ